MLRKCKKNLAWESLEERDEDVVRAQPEVEPGRQNLLGPVDYFRKNKHQHGLILQLAPVLVVRQVFPPSRGLSAADTHSILCPLALQCST